MPPQSALKPASQTRSGRRPPGSPGDDRPLNVAIVCYPTYGGSGFVATELGRLLAEAGHTVHMISYARPVRLAREFQGDIHYYEVPNVDYHVLNGSLYTVSLAVKIAEVARRHPIDVIHVHYAVPHAISAFIARSILGESSPPIITTLHGTDIILVGRNPALCSAVKLAIESSDTVTAVSRWLERETRRIFKTDKRIEVIHNFLDVPRFTAEGAAAEQTDGCCPRRHFAPRGEKILLHISNFRPVKRVADVVRVFDFVRRQTPSVLLMVGDGPERMQAEGLASQLRVEKFVHFLGNQLDIARFLRVADLMLFPSEFESFGMAALEAMAFGVPVVGARSGGLPEVVINGRHGYLTPPGDTRAMAEKAIKILRDPELHATMSRLCRQRVRRVFSARSKFPRYVELYREALARRRAG
ncbi:MAG: N-acetyl-alpha-D-glucosaminyl L-malate synthase BshA [Candidatus Sumerlaeia bacterium]